LFANCNFETHNQPKSKMENQPNHQIVWFEIPVKDTERAKTFYQNILNIQLTTQDMNGFKMSMFPGDAMKGEVSGALVEGPNYEPSHTGALVYLNAQPDLQHVQDRVEANGGKVFRPKFQISPEIGHMAIIGDTEGNIIALFSTN